MAGTRGENGDIAGRDLDLLARIAAEPDPRMAARDAENFMDRGVVVQIIVDAVAPHFAPAIGAEQSLDGFFGMIVIDGYRPLVDQKRHRVVRDEAVVLEREGERLDIVADHGHGNSPQLKQARVCRVKPGNDENATRASSPASDRRTA